MFSSSYSKIKILGSDPKITTKFEFKHNQIKVFKKLKLPVVENQIFRNVGDFKKNLKIKMPFIISEVNNSGGYGKILINNQEDLNFFNSSIPDELKNNYFIVSKGFVAQILFRV